MHSSTSNSDQRAPDGPWAITLLLTALVFICLLGSWELLWRHHGFSATLEDSLEMWLKARHELRPDSVAILGTSRAMAAVRPDTWQEVSGGEPPVHLGVVGGSPLPLLFDLATDRSFRGTALVDLVPRIVFDRTQHRCPGTLAAIEAYPVWLTQPSRRWETQLRFHYESLFAYRNAVILPPRLFSVIREWRLPDFPFIQLSADRSLRLDFDRVDPVATEQRLLAGIANDGVPMEHREAVEITRLINRSVDSILSHGGNVAFVRFPTAGRIHESETSRFPRDEYWDLLATTTRGVAIHFQDHPELSKFDCPDGSHIDDRDADSFTRALIDLLRRRNLRL